MTWPYRILHLTTDQKHQRRLLINRYAVYAQLSALIPVAAYQLYRLGLWVYSERQRAQIRYSELPNSPASEDRISDVGALRWHWRRFTWWLQGEIAESWGLRSQWFAAVIWTGWLLFLCFDQTGEDYLHVTKRFGAIAASHIPLHYMLSMKSFYSPMALALRSSHEQLNVWHRLCGRMIYFLLFCHATWYINFFLQANLLWKRFSDPIVIAGVSAFALLTALFITSLEAVRRWSYRVFFLVHLIIGVAILPLLWFHASSLRLFVAEALLLFIFDIICRNLDTVTGFATIKSIPDTRLIKIKIPIPKSKITRFQAAPGQHVYLSIPPKSMPKHTPTLFLQSLLFNPFTVAEVSSSDISLILRAQSGPTSRVLEHLSNLNRARLPINVEGPLGSSRGFPNIAAKYDRILLVAGGVGASFILPVYRYVKDLMEIESKSRKNIHFVWSVSSPAEANWAFEAEMGQLIDQEGIDIFLTRVDVEEPNRHYPTVAGVELASLRAGGRERRQRPDLKKVVDATFKSGNGRRVAILVCGPVGMAKELRSHVGRWVDRGREVWFHNESFGW